MQQLIPVPEETSQRFSEVAQKARMYWHMVNATGDPTPSSNFAQVNDFYPFEKASDRARSYVDASLQHLMMWADFHAPFKWHPEQTVTISLRPTMALARSALEAASQAVWLMDTTDPKECLRRHLSLIRWDFAEHRKSRPDADHKAAVKARDEELLKRVSEVFTEDDVKPPSGYLWVIQQACSASELKLQADDVERVWRAASGAVHGMYWVNLDLTDVSVGEEYEPGHFRAITTPASESLAEVLETAAAMTQHAALKYLHYSGADIGALIKPAVQWLAESITPNDPDSEVLKRLKKGEMPPNES